MAGGLKAGAVVRGPRSRVWQAMLPVGGAVGWDTCGLAL